MKWIKKQVNKYKNKTTNLVNKLNDSRLNEKKINSGILKEEEYLIN